MRLQFLGGTGTVTGSKYLFEHRGKRLLVDCGLFQGLKQLRLRNWAPLPVDPRSIDAVVLTHAHIDHSGFLPRFIELGFHGKVFSTPGTFDLCKLLLPDSGHLQEEEANYANRHGFSKHAPALPLYTEAEARRALSRFEVRDFDKPFEPLPGVVLRYRRAGHILGAASIHLQCDEGSILFSGDLGRSDDLLMKPPAPPDPADWVLIESTYGDRSHPDDDPLARLADVISRTAARGGITVMPAFAVGRAQTLLHALHVLKAAKRIPDLPVFLNSPMAADVTHLLQRLAADHRLSQQECRALSENVRIVNSEAESREINQLKFPAVVVSASGMATGGRVVHHIKAFAPDARNAIVFAGFQAAGTRGAALVGGAKQVKIHGEWIPVRAEVASIDGMSAHGDREDLLAWLAALPRAPRHVYVTHGEPVAADSLRQAIEERHRWPASVPEYLEWAET
ncbi:MAG: MBL fold metallo-hydrolase [Roseateles depolymerans]|uniref:MBL fold metallo-hydrolase n=1 Tax=Roseateles depolymerans TaxID=76731 RepID=A0A2W5DAM4_9BURK|nr:MAG: MBL fold metallo-hydrolase [Roseateles depolymerans]